MIWLVSCFFDLTKVYPGRSVEDFIQKSKGFLTANINRVLFISPSLVSMIPPSPGLTVVPMELKDIPLYGFYDQVKANRDAFNPTKDDRAPIENHLINCSKHLLLLSRKFRDRDQVAWVDFGKEVFSKEGLEEFVKLWKFPKEDILRFCYNDVLGGDVFASLQSYYTSYRFQICGSFVSGTYRAWKEALGVYLKIFIAHTEAGYGHADEQIWHWAIQCGLPHSAYCGNYQDVLLNYYSLRSDKPYVSYVMSQALVKGNLGLVRKFLAWNPDPAVMERYHLLTGLGRSI